MLKNISSFPSKFAAFRRGTFRLLLTKASTSTEKPAIEGLFGNFLLQTPKGFDLLTKAVHARSVELVREIVDGIEERAADPKSECVRCMHSDPKYTKAAEESMRFFTCLVETLNTTPELYFALKRSLETEAARLDPISLRTANMLLHEFELSGVLLSDSDRQHFVQLSDEIFDAGTRFVAGTDRPVPLSDDDRKILPSNLRGRELLEGPFSQHDDRKIRKFTFEKFYQHNEEQELFLKRLISARHQIAQMTGFPTFAHRAQINSILCTYGNVHKFLKNTIEGFSTQIVYDLDDILEITYPNVSYPLLTLKRPLVGYADIEFATTLRRRELMRSIENEIPPINEYFHFGTMLEGFESIVQKLYGISFEVSNPEPGECWLGNVIKLKVFREDENSSKTFLGVIFIDIDERASKLQGDCHFTVRCSKQLQNGEFQTPIVVLSLSLKGSLVCGIHLKSTIPTYELIEHVEMFPDEAENFFHEMGHAMHTILGRTVFQHVAGTRCPTDFAEVPSHLMECFFNDPKIFQKICRTKSGRALDDDLVVDLIKRQKVFPAVKNIQQAIYALVDLEMHGEHAEDIAQGKITTTELFVELSKEALPYFSVNSDYAYHHRISHLVTYGAKYYSYLLARASAAMIYKNLFAEDFKRENGEKWAEVVQSYGGEYPSDVLLAKALGRSTAPSIDQLTRSLIRDAMKYN
uniref:Peptidase_M3 domain-containing protein n=1 Tax=Meloidogyne hapla TaxID=6305 RepID=A0A1I8B330_MELHA